MKDIKVTKKELLALALAFSMAGSISACKKAESTYETTVVPTTVETTVETTVDTIDPYFEEEAKKFYESNKEFFVNQYGDNKEYAIRDIKNTILVITNNSETVTNQDLNSAFKSMSNMIMPTNVIQAAGNYMTNEPIEHVENVPNLGIFVEDEQARKIVGENTAVINNFINAMNDGTDEEKDLARKLLLQRIITVEENLDEYYYLGETSLGDELVLNMSNQALTNLSGTLVHNGVLEYTDKNGVDQTMFLIPDIRGAAILNTFWFAEEDGAPFDSQEIIDGDKKTTIYGRYVEFLGEDGFEREFVSQAEKNTIEDTLVVTKYNEAISYIENKYSKISSEHYNLNNDCTTLSK